MATDYSFLVPQILADKKYFDVSRSELVRQLLARGEAEVDTEHQVTDDYANTYTVVLRLNIHCKNQHVLGWTISLKLQRTRIDCIDWEPKFVDVDGVTHPMGGWHRHIWNTKKNSAERGKRAVDDLNSVESCEDFLIRTCNLMGVTLSATDYGTDELQFD